MKSIRLPKKGPVDFRKLKLSPEEGFVLSRVDSSTTVRDLVALTGLEEGRVVDIVERLAAEGALEVEGASAAPPAVEAELRAFLNGDAEPPPEQPQPVQSENVQSEDVQGESESESEDEEENESENDQSENEKEQRDERNHRRIYETVYHPMDRDRRVKAATEVGGDDLIALCLDPEPAIISAILTNPHYGIEHARMIAVYHRTQIGLEAIAKRSDHLKDALLQRRLLRNPQLPSTILGKMVSPKLMMDVYKIAIDREIPERSRLLTREGLRKKFMLSSADEKAALLTKTEGRCLIHLVNCSLDAHATQILCAKSGYSLLFIQNLARWSATPPPLLAHLLKLPAVRHNLGLRKMLLKHPNMPSDAKRSLK